MIRLLPGGGITSDDNEQSDWPPRKIPIEIEWRPVEEKVEDSRDSGRGDDDGDEAPATQEVAVRPPRTRGNVRRGPGSGTKSRKGRKEVPEV
jgi:hypothetical protein